MHAKYLLGCALFIDLLSPCAILSKIMQNDSLDILEALSAVLMALKETGILHVHNGYRSVAYICFSFGEM